MRVVAGRLGGRRLRAPAGGTRPTADRVREALFAMLGPVEGLDVLDLFAGSGALGIEAISRGAARAAFVDRSPRAVATVARNLADLGIEGRVERRDALAFLRHQGAEGAGYDLIFLDPPYSSADRLAGPLAELLPATLNREARIVIESDKRAPLELDMPLVRERSYGDTRIAIHHAA